MIAGPNLGFSLAIAGVLCIYCEFIRPGKVWPGIIGSMLLIFGAYSLSRYSPNSRGLLLLTVSAVLFVLEAFWNSRLISGIAGTVALAAGSWVLLAGPERISPLLGCLLSLVFGAATSYLANGAKVARRNKRADLEG
jgi:membrane-bound serine protease (ClpP class)